MRSQFFIYLQNILPQHLLSEFAGKLAESRSPALKNFLIKRFIKKYNIDMNEANIQNPGDYACFNDFFIRELRPELRPVATEKNVITSPVDGTVSAIGSIKEHQLLQAKNFYFQLTELLGGDKELAQDFYNGNYTTLYLAPHNYHRVHMPFSGKLLKTIYVPGKLFSVNKITTELVPNLFSRNERLISIFETEAGLMTVILVGAMIVGTIQTVWMKEPIRAKQIITKTFTNNIFLEKGAELGYFKLGSTVILLFQNDRTRWDSTLQPDSLIKYGQSLGIISDLSQK